jgi:hypothetical protein
MEFFEKVKDMSKDIDIETKVSAVLMFFNTTKDHMTVLAEAGFSPKTVKEMDDYNIIWYWRRWLIDQGVLKENKQKGEFAVERAK